MLIQTGARSGVRQFNSHRLLLLLVTGALLTLILSGRAAWLAGKRNARGSLGLEELCIPGLRGSILNTEGICLAWSERQLRMIWQLPQAHAEAVAARKRLACLPDVCALLPAEEELPEHLGKKLLLSEVFSGVLDPELLSLVETGDLFLEGYFVRHVRGSPEVLGAVMVDPVSGLELGVSGLEKEYDHRLRGKVLRYARVSGSGTLTRIYQSFFSDSGNGENVTVDLPLPESF